MTRFREWIDRLSVALCMPYLRGRFWNGPGYCASCRALARDIESLKCDVTTVKRGQIATIMAGSSQPSPRAQAALARRFTH